MSLAYLITRILIPATAVFVACISVSESQYLVSEQISVRAGSTARADAADLDWNGEYYYASGEGVIPSTSEEPNRAKAYLKGKGYAKMKAIANLLMAIEGTTISYKATGKDYIAKDETLMQTIEGYVSNVEVVEEKQQTIGGDAIITVTVKAPLYGSNGIGTAILRTKAALDSNESDRNGARVEVAAKNAATVEQEAKGPFSSLIVDCGGLSVERAMSPKIRKTDSTEVWGTISVDPVFLSEHGIVAYARSISEAKSNKRAGSNPLVVKACGRAGGRFYCDAVISDPDAEHILQENLISHFLDKYDVLFVIDTK